MGYAISWLAVKGQAPELVLQQLGLTPTGEMAEYGESLFTGRTLPNGWFILVINECEHEFVESKSVAALSSNCEVVACSIEEHVMVCTSELWRDCAQVWRIEHDAQKSIDHINTSGLLPDAYSAIKLELAEQQEQAGGKKADTDYFFDIPLEIAKSIVGFKHDEPRLEDESFEIFKGAASSPFANPTAYQGKRPWWKLW